jgi:hypothetical protein
MCKAVADSQRVCFVVRLSEEMAAALLEQFFDSHRLGPSSFDLAVVVPVQGFDYALN